MSNSNATNGKQQFTTGAQRDTQTGKPMPGLLSPFAAERKAWVMAKGAGHYGPRNWEKGMPFSRVIESAERHLMAYKQGQNDEDHLAQAGWNIDALLHYEEGIKRGFLPVELDDMPKYVLTSVYSPPTNGIASTGNIYDAVASEPTEPDYDEIDAEFDAMLDNAPVIDVAEYKLTKAMSALGTFGGSFDLYRAGPVDLLTAMEREWIKIEEESARHKLEKRTQASLDRIETYGSVMFNKLIDLGCDPEVAEHIVGGTTFSIRDDIVSDKFVYVAGPMRGYDNFNFPAFDAARDALLKNGYNVISPADIDRFVNPVADQVDKVDTTDQTVFIMRDFWSLFFAKKCGTEGAICMLFDWVKSKGAAGEFFLARWLGLKMLRFTKGPIRPENLWAINPHDLVKDYCLENQR